MNSLFFVKNFLFFFILVLMFIFKLAYAELSITPAVVNVVAEPMSVCESRYIVTNVSDNAVTVIVTKENWKNFSGNSNDVSVDNWLKLGKDKFDIAPKESAEVPFRVITSEKMIGSVSGMIVFTVKGEMFSLSMKQPVYVTINGTEQVDFKIDSVMLKTSKINGNLYYNMVVRNDGNVHIRHNGFIEIYDKKTGNLIKKVVIDETFPVYAQESRIFNGIVLSRKDLKKGKYIALFKINALKKEVVKKVKFEVSELEEVVADGRGWIFKGKVFRKSVHVMLYEIKGLVKRFFKKMKSCFLRLELSSLYN